MKKSKQTKVQETTQIVPCWMKEERCIMGIEGRFLTKIDHCLPCEVFKKAATGNGISNTEFLIQELKLYDQHIVTKLQEINRTLNANVDELSVLLELSNALQATTDLDERLFIILSGLTAGFALGFNRAMLFLVDESTNELVGKLGVGPASGEEANRIWSALSNQPVSLMRMINPESFAESKKSFLTQLAEKIRIPLKPDSGVLARTVLEKKPFLILDANTDPKVNIEIRNIMQAKTFATVPLLTKDRAVGAIHVDNIYNHAPITEEDIKSLMRFSTIAGLAIAEALAYERIEQFTEHLEEQITQAKAELQATEKELAHQEKLAALGQIAAGVAHELRNPMTAVRGFAQRIYRKLPDTDTNKKYAGIIIEEMDRINFLIKDVLDFARKPDPIYSKNNIHEIIEEVLFLFKEDFKKFPIEIKREYGNIPPFYFDENQIKQVVTNIIGNAIDVMEEGGTLTLKTRVEENWFYLEIQDTGPGIWPEILTDIFNPFFTTKSTGTGLGLSNAHRLVEMHGGDILVDTRVGQGTTFTVKLPFRMELLEDPHSSNRRNDTDLLSSVNSMERK